MGGDEIIILKDARSTGGTTGATLKVNGQELEGYKVRVTCSNSSTWHNVKKIVF